MAGIQVRRNHSVRAALAAVLWLSAVAMAVAQPVYDENNPVDMHGPDGLAFTPDDPLIAQGVYTETATALTVYAQKKNGTIVGGGPQDHYSLLLTSFNPQSGSVWVYPLYGDLPPSPAVSWRYEPLPTGPTVPAPPMDFWHYPYADAKTKPVATGKNASTWWNDGKNTRINYLRAHNWEWDGTTADPALRVCPRHFPDIEDYLKTFQIGKTRLDVGVLSVVNLDTGQCGIAAHAFCKVEDVRIEIEGEIDVSGFPFTTVEISGTITNANPKIHWEVEVAGIPTPFEGDYELEFQEAKKIVNGAREGLNANRGDLPPLPPLDAAGEARLQAGVSAGKLIDTVANEVCAAALRTGMWLPWLPTDDPVFRDSPAIDVSGTDFDTSHDKVKTAEVMGGTHPSATNNGMSYPIEEMLIYGRDPAPHSFSRLVEWYGAMWLNVNLAIVNPYGVAGQPPDKAAWHYHDLIIADNKPLTPSTPIDVSWPPPKYWNGGQGFLAFGQDAFGHAGNATGSDMSAGTAGDPKGVLAILAAIMPGASAPGTANEEAYYNLFGYAMNLGAPVLGADWVADPSTSYKLPWPPDNVADPEGVEVKFLNANVANGHDKVLSSGQFLVNWDFNADGTIETAWGNTSWPIGACETLLFVKDSVTKRTGFHQLTVVR